MKLLIRISGLITIFIIVSLTLVHLINMNVIINEMNDVSAIGIIQAQEFAIKTMLTNSNEVDEGVYVKSDETNNINYDSLNEEYKKIFSDYFNYSVTDKDIYDLEVKTNVNKGIIYVKIDCLKYPFVKDVELVNVVKFKKGYQTPNAWSQRQTVLPQSKYYKEVDVLEIANIPGKGDYSYLIKNENWPVTIYEWEFDELTKISKYDIKFHGYISTAYNLFSSYWYPGLKLSYKDTNGNYITLASKGENGKSGLKSLTGYCDIETNTMRLEMTGFKPKNGYITKIDRIIGTNSSISFNKTYYQYVIEWNKEIVKDYIEGSREVYYDYSYRYKDLKDINMGDLS